jgi:hypothetical protein
MNPKVFSERATFIIKKDKVGEIASIIEEKHFDSKWEALDYCKKRMDEIRAQERKEANDIGYDPFNQFVGVTSNFIPKKDDMFDYFVSMGGCKRFYTFSVMREVYLGRLGWSPRKYARIPKDPKERKALAKGLEGPK